MEGEIYGQWHIWVCDARGSEHGIRQLTDGAVADFHPAWSTDADHLYFSSDRSGAVEIWSTPFLPPTALQRSTWGAVKELYR
jgi:Tol biopolymer transport system component